MLIHSIDPILEPVMQCMDLFYARMFRDWPGAITRTVGDSTLCYSGDRVLTGANHLFPGTPDAVTPRLLDAAAAFFNPLGAAWSVIYTDTYMPQTIDLLHQRGYYVRWDSPLMVLEGPPHPAPVRPTAQVIRATTPEHLDGVIRVMGEAFGTHDAVNQRVARREHLTAPDVAHYLIYVGSEPAACATVVTMDTIAGVWNVGTRIRFRRQGYATALMHALLADMRARGATTSMLMASRAGYPLYTRLGYRRIGTTAYMGPPSADGL